MIRRNPLMCILIRIQRIQFLLNIRQRRMLKILLINWKDYIRLSDIRTNEYGK